MHLTLPLSPTRPRWFSVLQGVRAAISISFSFVLSFPSLQGLKKNEGNKKKKTKQLEKITKGFKLKCFIYVALEGIYIQNNKALVEDFWELLIFWERKRKRQLKSNRIQKVLSIYFALICHIHTMNTVFQVLAQWINSKINVEAQTTAGLTLRFM